MSPIGRNIHRLMRERNLTLPKLAIKADMDKGNLSRIIKTGRGYSAESLERIAAALAVPVAVLFSEEANVEFLAASVRRVPILDAIQAGSFTGVDRFLRDEDMQEYTYTSSAYSAKTFAMRVKGDSMIPDFLPGDLVIVDPDSPANPGSFVVAVNGDGEAMLKRYADRGLNGDGKQVFELVPSNPMYPTYRSDLMVLRIIGVVRERTIKLR